MNVSAIKRSFPKNPVVWLGAVLLLALALRLYHLQDPAQALSCDEQNYIFSGAVLWEGMLPSYKIAPAAITTWISWGYCAAATAVEFIRLSFPAATGAPASPLLLRPYQAIQYALFDLYRNPLPLKNIMVFLSLLFSLSAVAASFRIGEKKMGLSGGLIAGAIAACVPTLVEHSVMATAYSFSWALGAWALYFIAVPGKPRAVLSGMFIGLAIASRIEMTQLLFFLVWELWNREETGLRVKRTAQLLATAIITILIASPWIVIGIIEMARVVLITRFICLSPLSEYLGKLLTGLTETGAIFLFFTAVFGLTLAHRKNRVYSLGFLAYTLLLIVMIFIREKDTPFRYDGPLYTSLALTMPVAVGNLRRFIPKISGIYVAVGVLIAINYNISFSNALRFYYAPQRAVEWIEKNVPEGTTVYLPIYASFTTLLPDKGSSDRIWERANSMNACAQKFRFGASRVSIHTPFVPRAYCEEIMHLERALSRRWFILGSERPGVQAPRYNLIPYPVSFRTGPTKIQALREFLTHGGVFVSHYNRIYGLDRYIAASWKSPSNVNTEYVYILPKGFLRPRDTF